MPSGRGRAGPDRRPGRISTHTSSTRPCASTTSTSATRRPRSSSPSTRSTSRGSGPAAGATSSTPSTSAATWPRCIDAGDRRRASSPGFDSYFGEYRTTEAARKGVRRTYHESVLIPCPKAKVRFVLESRDRQNALQPLFSAEIDPAPRGHHPRAARRRGPGVRGPHARRPARQGRRRHPRRGLHRRARRASSAPTWPGSPASSSRPSRTVPPGQLQRARRLQALEESGCDEPSHGVHRNTARSARRSTRSARNATC